MNGIFNIFKPKNIQSFDIIRQVRKKINLKKVGYVGTLDNFASGILIVAVGKATKLIPYLLSLPKQYKAQIVFGKTTDTLDIKGHLVKSSEFELNELQLKSVVSDFIGEYWQIPPEFSSKKIYGKRASDLKRAGKTVHLSPVLVKIYDIQILNINFEETYAEFMVSCSSGTYIRSLARDIAKKLGTIGYVSNLQRMKNGYFSIEESLSVEDITDNNYISMREALYFYDELRILDDKASKLAYGKPLFLEDFNKINLKNGIFRVILEERLIAIVKYENGKFEYLNNFYE